MQSKSKWPTILIIAITVGLVLGPVFVPREISRWYLAAAHNAFRVKNSELAEHYLQRAEAWDPNIKKDGDYWIAQLPRASVQNTDQLLDLIERAVMTDSRWSPRATQAAKILSEEYDFVHAVRALKISLLGQRPTAADDLNHLAYMRSLAGIELEEALKDIDRAIDLEGPLPSLLDTKAWVLHGMRRNLEALGFMNEALVGMERDFKKAGVPLPEPIAAEEASSNSKDKAGADPSKPDAARSQPLAEAEQELLGLDFLDTVLDNDLRPTISQRQAEIQQTRRRMGEAGFVLAVMRFHRLRILEALKDARAEDDRRWLEERGVPVVDELF